MHTPRAAIADKLVDQLVGSGKLYPEDAAMLKRLSSEGVLPSKYGEALNRLVKVFFVFPKSLEIFFLQ